MFLKTIDAVNATNGGWFKDALSDNKVKIGKIYTLHPIILCYMDIPMHPSFF